MEYFEYVVKEEDNGNRIDSVLADKKEGLSRALIKKFKEHLLLNGKNVKLSHKVREKDQISIEYKLEIIVRELKPEKLDIPIVYEDEHLMVVNKPFGMVVHPAKGNWSGTVINGLYSHLKMESGEDLRPGIVHRLDKGTSGLLVVAKDLEAQQKMMKLFRKRRVLKIYHTLVSDFLKYSQGEIDLPILRHPKNRMKYTTSEEGKASLTEYKLIKEFKKGSWLEINLHTGRTHQIRVHLSAIGNPVVGDKLYGSNFNQYPLCLVAKKIGFEHPIFKEYMEWEIELPHYFNKVIKEFEAK